MKKQSGFNLVELLIVVTIIGIIMGFAIPAYQSYGEKARRSDGMAKLVEVAQWQEKWYNQNNAYSGNANPFSGDSEIDSDEGYYEISVSASGTTYTATASGQGAQANDSECGSMTINQLGVKSPRSCWK